MLFQVKIYILTKNIPAVKKSEPEKVLVTTIPWCETNIPIEESIQIILDFIEIQNNPTYPPLCILKQLLIFVLNYNVFNFGNLLFLQVHDITMGTKLTPNYANLFMGDFESKHVFTYPP